MLISINSELDEVISELGFTPMSEELFKVQTILETLKLYANSSREFNVKIELDSKLEIIKIWNNSYYIAQSIWGDGPYYLVKDIAKHWDDIVNDNMDNWHDKFLEEDN